VSGGVGYIDPKWGIELSLRRDVRGGEATEAMLGFRYFVQ
jgi:hypothetical protein